MGRPKLSPKLPFPFDDRRPHLTHPPLDRPHSPSETASGPILPFFHSTLSGQTDRQTHRPTDGLCDTRYIDRERRASNMLLLGDATNATDVTLDWNESMALTYVNNSTLNNDDEQILDIVLLSVRCLLYSVTVDHPSSSCVPFVILDSENDLNLRR